MRMFVAVRPSQEAVEDLDAFLSVRRAAAGFRWTRPEHLHLTLAFLADVPDHRLDDLAERLGEAAARRTPFPTALAGGGAFPDPARGRVLLVRPELTEEAGAELDLLAVGCHNAASKAGTAVDGQRFRPHVTVARCGQPTELSSWVRLLDGYRGPAWTVESVSLVASHLGEGGPQRRPRYEDVAELGLGQRPA